MEYRRRNIINDIKERFPMMITTRSNVSNMLLYILDLGITMDETLKRELFKLLPNDIVRGYFLLAYPEVQNFQMAKRASERLSKTQINFDDFSSVSKDFKLACKNYQAYQKYVPQSNKEATILENIWSYKVTQFNQLIHYKNPTIYHIPMGGINKKR